MSDWSHLSLGRLEDEGKVQLGRGNVISRIDIREKPGPHPIYSSSASGNGEFGRYGDFMFDEELISWSIDGGGRFFYRPKHRFSVTNVAGYLRVLSDSIHCRYLFEALSYQHSLVSFDYQTKAHPSVIRDLYTIPLPPLSEQRKIAAILSSVDVAIEKTEALIAKLRDLKTAMMQELLTKGIGHKRFKHSPLGRIPEEWEVVRLGDVASLQSGIAKNSGITGTSAVSLPYLRVANVQDGFVDLSEIKYIEVEADQVSRYLLQCDDVLFNEGGDFDKLGRGCVWRSQISPMLHQNHVFAVRCGPRLLPDYLACYSASSMGKRFFLGSSKQTTNLASINATQLRHFPIPLPPVSEQQNISGVLNGLQHRLSATDGRMSRLQSLKKALMQDLLTGRVRVKV